MSRPTCNTAKPGHSGVYCTRGKGHAGGHLDEGNGVYWQAGMIPCGAGLDIDADERERRQADRLVRLADAIGTLR